MPAPVESRGLILRLLQGSTQDPWGQDPDAFRPESARAAIQALRWLYGPGGYFKVEVQGWENVPPAPVMMVGNHSGGTSIPDVWAFASQWYEHFGFERIIHPMAHEMVFSTRFTGAPFTRMGVLRAQPARAVEILRRWRRDLLVMPGGDRDTWRPWTARYQVQFAGRKGYIRTALAAGVPIVPVAHSGAHNTLLVLSDGHRLARRIGLHKVARAQVFPIHLSLPWGLAMGPMPHWPLPTHMRYRIRPPIYPPAGWEPGQEPPPELVEELDERVRTSIQQGLDELRAERPAWRKAVADRMERALGPPKA